MHLDRGVRTASGCGRTQRLQTAQDSELCATTSALKNQITRTLAFFLMQLTHQRTSFLLTPVSCTERDQDVTTEEGRGEERGREGDPQ